MESKLYSETLRDHYHNPRHAGNLESPDFTATSKNVSCGDVVTIEGIMQGDRLVEVRHRGEGCMVSQAMASVISDLALGKTREEIRTISADDAARVTGIVFGPNRQRCAILALEALQKGMRDA